MKLETQIKKWQNAGLIGAKEAQAILEHEEHQPEKSYILYGIVAIGITTLILGLISIITANWNFITPLTKLISYFILQGALGFGYLKISEDKGLLKAGFLWLFSLNFFGGIGLVGQIFHLSSAVWKPYAFWLLLTFFPALLEKRRLLIHAWMICFFITVSLFLSTHHYSPLYFCSAAFLVTAVGLNGLTRFIRFSENFERVALTYGIFMVLVSSSLLGNFLRVDIIHYLGFNSSNKFLTTTILFLTACITLVSANLRTPSLTPAIKSKLMGLTGILLAYLISPYFFVLPTKVLGDVIGAIGFIAIWAMAAWIAACLDSKRLYNIFTFVVALRFIGVYFEVFGSLLATGFGLIVSGFVILLTAFLWNRYRRSFLQWVQKTS